MSKFSVEFLKRGICVITRGETHYMQYEDIASMYSTTPNHFVHLLGERQFVITNRNRSALNIRIRDVDSEDCLDLMLSFNKHMHNFYSVTNNKN